MLAAIKFRPGYETGEGKVKGAIYKAISNELKQHGIERTPKQCDNHASHLKTKWNDRQFLLQQSGFGVSPDGRITCGEGAWRAFITQVSYYFVNNTTKEFSYLQVYIYRVIKHLAIIGIAIKFSPI